MRDQSHNLKVGDLLWRQVGMRHGYAHTSDMNYDATERGVMCRSGISSSFLPNLFWEIRPAKSQNLNVRGLATFLDKEPEGHWTHLEVVKVGASHVVGQPVALCDIDDYLKFRHECYCRYTDKSFPSMNAAEPVLIQFIQNWLAERRKS